MGIQSWSIEGEQTGGTPPHAVTHHQGGTDELSAEAIGAEAEGTAEAAILSHVGAVDPHPQYWREDEFIPWARIIGAPSDATPPLIFNPFSTDEWVLHDGFLPELISIADPPINNENLPCWLGKIGSRFRRHFYTVPTAFKTYRITLFARSLSGSLTLRTAFYRITTSGLIAETVVTVLEMNNQWQQVDITVSNVNSSNTQVITGIFAVQSGVAGQTCQIYNPQFSIGA